MIESRDPLWRHVAYASTTETADDVRAAFRAFRTRTTGQPPRIAIEREHTEAELVGRDCLLLDRMRGDTERAPVAFVTCDS